VGTAFALMLTTVAGLFALAYVLLKRGTGIRD